MRRVGWSRLDLILVFHPTAKAQLINFKQYVYVYIYTHYVEVLCSCDVRALCDLCFFVSYNALSICWKFACGSSRYWFTYN